MKLWELITLVLSAPVLVVGLTVIYLDTFLYSKFWNKLFIRYIKWILMPYLLLVPILALGGVI